MSGEEKMSDKMNAVPNTDMNEQNASDQTGKTTTDLDSAWKDVIDGLFEPFTEFFFPQIHRDIDFSKGIEILDSKSTGISPYGNVGKRYADELVKVRKTVPWRAFVYLSILKFKVPGKRRVYSPNEPISTTTGLSIRTSTKESKSSVLRY
jgi:hypothetical protein